MPFYFYGFDWTYVVLVLPCLILSLWASARVNSTFQKYSSAYSIRRITAPGYFPIKVRAAIIPQTNFGSKLAMPLILLGLLFSAFGNFSYTLVYVGIACFGLSLVFQLVTLPVEFNASRRAMEAIASGNLLTEDEQRGARKTLSAAAMTYVAATATALAQLLRLLLIFGRRSGRRDD